MPRIPGLARRFPWLMALEAVKVGREHWMNLTPAERSKLGGLLKKSKGRPANLTPRERTELGRLAKKLDLPEAGRKLVPFGGALRRRR